MLTIKFPESCVNFIAYDSRRGRVTKLTFCFNICKSKFDLFLPSKEKWPDTIKGRDSRCPAFIREKRLPIYLMTTRTGAVAVEVVMI